MKCRECGADTGIGHSRGRIRRYCSAACKQRAYRRRRDDRRIPEQLTALDRWTRADHKRPIQTTGHAASTTDPSTWTSYAEVTTATAGTGYGVMLGDGLVCIDLDHALDGDTLTETARHVLDACPGAWVERSVSGTGLHIFGAGFERAGRRLVATDGTGIELYARARFIRVTGDTFRPGGLPVLDFDDLTKSVATR